MPKRGKRLVRNGELSVGQPLPWDVFDLKGAHLLSRGFVIDSQLSLDQLLFDGLLCNAKDRGPVAAPVPKVKKPSTLPFRQVEEPSALQYLLDARRLIGQPTQDMEKILDFPGHVLKIAQLIDLACQTHADVALATTLLLQDGNYVVQHHVNAAIVSNLVARTMAMSPTQVSALTAAALTMNIGMHEIQDKLNDLRGQINDKIRALIKLHPQQSAQRLRKYGVANAYWLRCVEQHHEHDNGSGYPRGLLGKDIEPGAKIIGLAEQYCARIAIRAYCPPQPPNVVLKDLFINRGAEIDPIVAASLIRIIGIYPPGTVVRLRNAEIAVVVKSADHQDSPLACSILSPSGVALEAPRERETSRDEFNILNVLTPDKVHFPIPMSRLWGNAARLR